MELDTSNNKILYEWNAKDHLALNESDLHSSSEHTLAEICSDQGRPWGKPAFAEPLLLLQLTRTDAQHVNSIDKFPDGDYLLSARNADALYKVRWSTLALLNHTAHTK